MTLKSENSTGELIDAGGGIGLVSANSPGLWGDSIPASGQPGFAHGCIFHNTKGTTGLDAVYFNAGTLASCDFKSLSEIQAAIDLLTAGTVTASQSVVVDANKDVSGFRNIAVTGRIRGPGQQIAAIGADQAGAAALVEGVNYVTGANGAKGVRLPAGSLTLGQAQIVIVVNALGSNLLVYPASSGAIESGAADDPLTMAGTKRAIFVNSGGDGVGGTGIWFELLGA